MGGVCFSILNVNLPQNTMQMDLTENPGPGDWNPGLFSLTSIIKMECFMQHWYVDHKVLPQ